MRAIDCRQDTLPLTVGHLGLTSQTLCGAGNRCLPPQVYRLGMDGIAQVALQRRAPLRCYYPDLIEVIGRHITNEDVRHTSMLSLSISPL